MFSQDQLKRFAQEFTPRPFTEAPAAIEGP